MPNPWVDSVKRTGQLSIYTGDSVTGPWAAAVRDAINEFNALSRRNRLGLALTESHPIVMMLRRAPTKQEMRQQKLLCH